MLTLDKISVNKFAIIKELHSKGMLRERMLALGITPGTKVQVIREGPFKETTLYNIRGTMIALRKEEASLISVYDC